MPDFEPLYTSDELRAAESGHDTSELMERAGAGAAELALQI
jgi:NAD(P)H-hydrate repair Nnr-like enzyme with NAD(P)H-hydrate epimerase domain